MKKSINKILEDDRFFIDLVDSINRAKKEILISTYLFYMGNSENNNALKVITALGKASKRKVKVKILVEKHKDEEFKRTISYIKSKGIQVKVYNSSKINHEKVIVIDKEFAYIGSHNMAHNSLSGVNNEISVRINSKIIANKLYSRIIRKW